MINLGFPGGSVAKHLSASAEDTGSILWLGKIPWRGDGYPTPVFSPRKTHGQSKPGSQVHGVTASNTTE